MGTAASGIRRLSGTARSITDGRSAVGKTGVARRSVGGSNGVSMAARRMGRNGGGGRRSLSAAIATGVSNGRRAVAMTFAGCDVDRPGNGVIRLNSGSGEVRIVFRFTGPRVF